MHYCPSAIFAGGNWVITFNQSSLHKNVGFVRLSLDGQVLDDPPVNSLQSRVLLINDGKQALGDWEVNFEGATDSGTWTTSPVN